MKELTSEHLCCYNCGYYNHTTKSCGLHFFQMGLVKDCLGTHCIDFHTKNGELLSVEEIREQLTKSKLE